MADKGKTKVYYGPIMPPAAEEQLDLERLPNALVKSLHESGYTVEIRKGLWAGSYAVIYECTEVATGKLFACKITRRKRLSSDVFDLAKMEENLIENVACLSKPCGIDHEIHTIKVCHENGVMHLDVRPDNFVSVSADGNVCFKLIDFGSSLQFTGQEITRKPVNITPYTALEIKDCRGVKAADI
ncbi:calcium-dependent protein kinase 14-like [Bidens hawaiensis]|uniref:calcium-dependent protein kinase 14-like n=1 Tax=Bidens hawaiensis TaxID=980011 RepID=UPI004049491B